MGLFNRYKIQPPSVPGDPADTRTNRIAGVGYECRKDPKKKRLDVLKSLKVGAPLVLEYYEYEGRPAYMVVDCKSGLDIGTLHEGTAVSLKESFPNAVFVAKIVENNKFDVSVTYDIYGERMVYYSMTKGHANVIYRAYKDKQVSLTKKEINKIYEISEMEGEQPKELVSSLRRAVEKIFQQDYIGANSILKDAFK
ncbi:MAG: hypothetical protein J6S50_00450 [Oscillospiraceae bacterium]|nr:hypothetical protein [Oscillospiraceae bacterium]MBO7726971.1 hypothetical protein [Oscillospiraceae bacterium]